MGAIVVLAVAALITIGLGFETVVVAVGVAFVFAFAFSSFTDKYYPSLYGLVVAGMAYFAAGILSILIDGGFWGFWIAYIVALLFLGFSFSRSGTKAEKEAQPVLKELQDFLEDYAHFMPDHLRRAEVYWEGMGIQIKLFTWDAEIERDTYREYDCEHVDPNPFFFGEYQPISKHYYKCYMLLDEGTPELREGSFVYTWTLAVLGQKKYLFPVLSNRMKDRYSGSFNGYKDGFSINFNRIK